MNRLVLMANAFIAPANDILGNFLAQNLAIPCAVLPSALVDSNGHVAACVTLSTCTLFEGLLIKVFDGLRAA